MPSIAPRSRLVAGCLTLLLALLSPACDDDATSSTASYVPTHPAPGTETAALWRPAALVAAPDGRTVYVAEQAARRVRAIDVLTGASRVVFDVSEHPETPGLREDRWDLDWGQALLALPDQRLLLAGTGRPLIVLDPTGLTAPEVIGAPGGSGQAPRAGVALSALDFSTLQGLAVVEGRSELVLALGARLWRARADRPEALADATLEPLAGDGRRAAGADVADALSNPLDLRPGRWEALLAEPTGRVWLIEVDRLRLIGEGRIVTVTGRGSMTGVGPLPLESFGARFGRSSATRAGWYDGAPHVVDHTVVRRVDLESVDFESGAVVGTIRAASYELPEIGGLTSLNGRLIVSFGLGGSLVELVPGEGGPEARPVFGPLDDWSTRYAVLTPEHAPWRLDGVLRPQALVSFGAGSLTVVAQTLARMASSIDRSAPPGELPSGLESLCATPAPDALAVCSFWGASSGIGPMASDNWLRFIRVERGTVVSADLGATEEWRVAQLTAPVASGIPGPARDVILQAPARLVAAPQALVLWMPGLLVRHDPARERIEHEVGPPRGRSPLRPRSEGSASQGVPFFALDLHQATAVAAGPGGLRAVAVADPEREGGFVLGAGAAGRDVEVAGEQVARNTFERVLGGGMQPLVPGVAADAVLLEGIDAVTLLAEEAPDGTVVATVMAAVLARDEDGVAQARLVRVGADARVEPLEGACGHLPLRADQLELFFAADDAVPALVLLHEAGGRRLMACRPADAPAVALGQRQLEAEAWLELAESRLPVARSGPHLLRFDDSRGVPVVSLSTVTLGDAQPVAEQRYDVLLGRKERVESVALDGERVSLLVDGPDGRLLVEGYLPGSGGEPTLPTVRHVAGGGLALSSGQLARQTMFGAVLETLALGPDGSVYLAVSDTAALWRITPGDDGYARESDVAELLHVGAPIFDGGPGPWPMTVTRSGELWVGSGERVFALREAGLQRAAGGGLRAPADGVPALEASLGRVRGLAAEGETVYVLSARGLFAIEARDGRAARLRVLAQDGALVLEDGTRYRLDVDTMAQPPLVAGQPGELLLAAPDLNRILTIPTDARPGAAAR